LLLFYTGIVNGYELPKLLFVGLLVIFGLGYLLESKKVSLPCQYPIALFFAGSVLSAWGALNHYELVLALSLDLMGISLFWIIVNAVKPMAMEGILWGLSMIGATIALFFIFLPGDQGSIGNSALAGIFMVPLIPIAVYLAPWGLIPAAIIGAGIYVTNSHAAFLGGLVIVAVVIWRNAAVCPKTLAIIPTVIASLLILKMGIGADTSIRYRLDWWRNSAYMVADHPVFGIGRGNYVVVYPQYAILGDRVMQGQANVNRVGQTIKTAIHSPHNDYLQLLVEGGPITLVGLVWFLWMMWTRFQWRTASRAAKTLALSMLGFLVTAAFHFPLQTVSGVVMFWVLNGLLWVASEKNLDSDATGFPGGILPGELDAG
jgi:O-antigen ligase